MVNTVMKLGKDKVMTKYAVDFYLPNSVVTVHVDADSEESAHESARILFRKDLGYSEISNILHNAQDVFVEPID